MTETTREQDITSLFKPDELFPIRLCLSRIRDQAPAQDLQQDPDVTPAYYALWNAGYMDLSYQLTPEGHRLLNSNAWRIQRRDRGEMFTPDEMDNYMQAMAPDMLFYGKYRLDVKEHEDVFESAEKNARNAIEQTFIRYFATLRELPEGRLDNLFVHPKRIELEKKDVNIFLRGILSVSEANVPPSLVDGTIHGHEGISNYSMLVAARSEDGRYAVSLQDRIEYDAPNRAGTREQDRVLTKANAVLSHVKGK